ncbi:MAG: hypothetical protein KKE61_04315, partial [Proteobacteria bacterium]|nr:hypothetical protein [Pseudomonadota bacterium]
MIKLHDKFKDKKFIVLGIDIKENRETVKNYVAAKGMPFAV